MADDDDSMMFSLYSLSARISSSRRSPTCAGTSSTSWRAIFGRPLAFYLFTLPIWQMAAGWLLTVALPIFAMGLFFFVASGGRRLLRGRRVPGDAGTARGLALAWALLLLALVMFVPLLVGLSYAFRNIQLFNPFAAMAVGQPGSAPQAKPQPPSPGKDDLQALKEQLSAMQQKLDSITGK